MVKMRAPVVTVQSISRWFHSLQPALSCWPSQALTFLRVMTLVAPSTCCACQIKPFEVMKVSHTKFCLLYYYCFARSPLDFWYRLCILMQTVSLCDRIPLPAVSLRLHFLEVAANGQKVRLRLWELVKQVITSCAYLHNSGIIQTKMQSILFHAHFKACKRR